MPRRTKYIEYYDFIMTFNGNLYKQLTNVVDELRNANPDNKYFLYYEDKITYLLIAFKCEQILYRQAYALQILKPKDKRSYRLSNEDIYREMKTSNNKDYLRYLKFIKARLPNKEIYEQYKLSAYNPVKKRQFYNQVPHGSELFTQDDQLRCKYNELLTFSIQTTTEIHSVSVSVSRYPFQYLMAFKEFDSLIPIHKASHYNIRGLDWYKRPIRDLCGSNVQVYFDLIRFMQESLYLPAIIGLITIAVNLHYGYTADDSPMDSIYALIVVLWGVIFVCRWEKEQKWIKTKEQTGYSDAWALHQKMVSKSMFQTKISPITGEMEETIGIPLKIFFYVRSWLILLPLVIVTLYFMIFSLNARGFIDPSHKLLYWYGIAQMAETGGIFDANSNKAILIVILHVVFTNLLDEHVYRPLARYTTKLEHHLDVKAYYNSIILKYFIYEFLITFADMFYIAFVRFDIMGLKYQLVSLFFVDIIRRLVSETFIPWSIKTYKSKKYKNYYAKGKLDQEGLIKAQVAIEVGKPTYEPFDDYLEIVTNYSYLVMLSSCFPIAPVLILLAHFIEVIHDKYKILFIYQRALPKKFQGIGFWKQLLVGITYFSILTNILLFAFSSQQIVGFFPKLFNASSKVIMGTSDIGTFISEAVMGLDELSGFTPTSSTASTTTIGTSCPSDPMSILTYPAFFEFNVKTRAPPTYENRATFVIVVFIIYHICIFLTMLIRMVILNRKGLAEIFQERKNYKRSIKLKIPKDSLNRVIEYSMN